MQTLSGQRVLTVGATVYFWEDVVLAGLLWGDWMALEDRVRGGLACLARLDDPDKDDEELLDEADVEAAAAEFRYARDLVAASDLETWLEERGLSVEAWLDFIRRSLLRDRWANDLDEIREAYELDEAGIAEAVVCEALCSGLANDLAQRLAARAAIHARTAGEANAAGESAAVDATGEGPADEVLERALPDMPEAARRERLAWLARLDIAWRRFTADVAPLPAVRAAIAARRLEWVRVGMQAVVVPDEDVAREIALCLRIDQRPVDEVAGEAGLRAETLEWWLDIVEEPLRDTLIGAQPGEVVGPVPWDAQYLVLMVTAKHLPSEEDPAVRTRAEQALLARAVDREVADRVRWHATL